MGMKPYEAAMKGSKEIGFTVLSMSTSLIAVFIPILLMGGIVGKLFREFAVTLSGGHRGFAAGLADHDADAVREVSQVARREPPRAVLSQRVENGVPLAARRIRPGLRWVLRHQWLMLGVAVGMAFLNIYLFMIVPKGFFPQQDTGRLGGQTLAAQDISFPAMRDKQRSWRRWCWTIRR